VLVPTVAIFVPMLLSLLGPAADQRKALPAGEWGGDQVSLSVTDNGARLELACAHGSIETAILLDEDGRFDVAGAYVREGPGPVRLEDEGGEPARFSGRVEGDSMTLSVERTTGARKVGTFQLEKGRAARIHKCQ
jgi:hypothetical protein